MRESKSVIFLVSPFIPYPPARGIELRIFRLLTWMHAAGYKVVLIIPADDIDAGALSHLRPITYAIHWTRPALRTRVGMRFPVLRRALWENGKVIARRLQRAKAASFVGPDRENNTNYSEPIAVVPALRQGDDQIKAWFAPDRLVALVGKLARRYRPRAVIVEYIFSTPVFAKLPGAVVKIVDTIDVFSRKEDQVLAFGIADPLACGEREERRALLRADVIVAIQSREQTLLQELVPEREVILTGIDLDVTAAAEPKAVVPDSIVVVASDNALNVHGLRAFLAECWPLIVASHPRASLHVVGRVGDICRVDDDRIRYSGWVEDLDRVYKDASIVINPTIAGTGLKIKSVQALAHGKALVAWTYGVEGLDYVGEPPFVECRSWSDFARAVVHLLQSEKDRVALEERARSYAEQAFGAATVYASLDACLRQPRGQIRDVRLTSVENAVVRSHLATDKVG